MLTPDDEIAGSEDMIGLDEVTARIKYMEAHDCAGEREGEDGCESVGSCPSCYGEAEEELAALRELEAEMRAHTGGQGDRATAIHESYLEEFVQEEAADIEGISPDSHLFGYVRWSDLARARTIDMSPATFRGSEYWITT
jgi:hypothetical protein